MKTGPAEEVAPRPMILGLAGPVSVIYLLCAAWLLLVATGILTYVDDDGRIVGPAVALLAALSCALISLTGWAVYRLKPWSRPLLLWLPVPLTVIIAGIAYFSDLGVGGALAAYAPTSVTWVGLLYWYLYRKPNVVAYFEQTD